MFVFRTSVWKDAKQKKRVKILKFRFSFLDETSSLEKFSGEMNEDENVFLLSPLNFALFLVIKMYLSYKMENKNKTTWS